MSAHGIVIVGAGVAGLSAAVSLRDAGRVVRLVDKASAPGGRLASRATPGGRVATGATHATVTDEEVGAVLARWGAARDADGRWRLDPVELGRRAAAALPLERALVTRLDATAGAVGVVVEGGSRTVPAAAVVCTPPLPQVCALLARSGLPVPEELAGVTYAPRLVLLAELASPVALPSAPSAPLERWHDGTGAAGTTTTSVVVHATVARSVEDHAGDATLAHARLLEALRDQLPQARVVWSDLKRWRYATVGRGRAVGTHHRVPGTAVWLAGDGLVAAADGGTEVGVAAAVRSGLDVARAVLDAHP